MFKRILQKAHRPTEPSPNWALAGTAVEQNWHFSVLFVSTFLQGSGAIVDVCRTFPVLAGSSEWLNGSSLN